MSAFSKPEIVAEIGQNHQGNPDIAIKYIEEFSRLGATCVKFQIRDNKNLFDSSRYDLTYDSTNSFGKTYGAHREFLELSNGDLIRLRKCAQEIGVKFWCTPFDEKSLETLVKIKVDAIKCASFDLANIRFLKKMRETDLPVVLSTGGGGLDDVLASVEALDSGQAIGILHCTSEYPCTAEKIDLMMIKELGDTFKKSNHTIGISDHYNGTLTGPLAFMVGASIFEKHVTFDRSQKGSDHKFSLEPDGFRKFVRDIGRAEKMLLTHNRDFRGGEEVFTRLGKSCIAANNLEQGQSISIDDIGGKIFDRQYIPIRDSRHIVGRVVNQDILAGTRIEYSMLK